jgi:hypothetical protein
VRFAQPEPPRPDFAFPAGRAAVDVPFELHNGHLFVRVMLNGKGPFRMLFDSASNSVLLPKDRLGDRPRAHRRRAERRRRRASTASTWAACCSSGRRSPPPTRRFLRRVEGMTDIAGVIGFEIFKRLPVKLDYERARATLFDPREVQVRRRGVARAVELRGQQATVRAASTATPGCSWSTRATAARSRCRKRSRRPQAARALRVEARSRVRREHRRTVARHARARATLELGEVTITDR